jgi:hypothetical protein
MIASPPRWKIRKQSVMDIGMAYSFAHIFSAPMPIALVQRKQQWLYYRWNYSIRRDSSRKGVSDDAVPQVRGMNVVKATAYPGIGTDVGCRYAAESA